MKVCNISPLRYQENSSNSPKFGQMKFFDEGVKHTILKFIAEQEDINTQKYMIKAINYTKKKLRKTKFIDVVCDLYMRPGEDVEHLGFYIERIPEDASPVFYDYTNFKSIVKAVKRMDKVCKKAAKKEKELLKKVWKTLLEINSQKPSRAVTNAAQNDKKANRILSKMESIDY